MTIIIIMPVLSQEYTEITLWPGKGPQNVACMSFLFP